MGEPVQISSFIISAEGKMELFGTDGGPIKPVSTILERSYPRAKNDKVLSSIPLVGTEVVTDPDLALMGHSHIVFIDGNEREISGKRVTVVATIRVRCVPGAEHIEHQIGAAFEFHELDRNADLVAIRLLCSVLEKQRATGDSFPVAFVIDSDLGKFRDFRARTLPLYEDWLLPEWAHLVFASDAAADSLVNRFLRLAHDTSIGLLNVIESRPLDPLPMHFAGPRTEYFRVWTKQPK